MRRRRSVLKIHHTPGMFAKDTPHTRVVLLFVCMGGAGVGESVDVQVYSGGGRE